MGDGATRAAGGSMVGGAGIGLMAVYKQDAAVWSETQRRTADTFAADFFGCSVAISGDGSILAVDERSDDVAASNAGAVWIFPVA